MEKLEIRRNIFHILMGIFFIILINYNLIDKFLFGIAIIIFWILFYISKKERLPVISYLVDMLERKENKKKFPGKGFLFYLLGVEIALILFPDKNIVMASIAILAIGDSIPSFVGSMYGKIKHPFSNKKFLEAAFVGAILAFIAASLFVRWYEALLASLIAIFIEGIDREAGLEQIDDNVIIPIIAGSVIVIIRFII
jgi:dolichol kinase